MHQCVSWNCFGFAIAAAWACQDICVRTGPVQGSLTRFARVRPVCAFDLPARRTARPEVRPQTIGTTSKEQGRVYHFLIFRGDSSSLEEVTPVYSHVTTRCEGSSLAYEVISY